MESGAVFAGLHPNPHHLLLCPARSAIKLLPPLTDKKPLFTHPLPLQAAAAAAFPVRVFAIYLLLILYFYLIFSAFSNWLCVFWLVLPLQKQSRCVPFGNHGKSNKSNVNLLRVVSPTRFGIVFCIVKLTCGILRFCCCFWFWFSSDSRIFVFPLFNCWLRCCISVLRIFIVFPVLILWIWIWFWQRCCIRNSWDRLG